MDRRQPPEQVDILLGAVKGVYGPQNTPMLWRFIIAGALWGPYTPSTPPKITSASSGGCKLFIRSVGAERKASCGVLGVHFCRRRPWLWWLWRQLCYVIRLLKISIKILKLVVCNKYLYVLLYCKTCYHSRIASCSVDRAQVVWWPEPKPLWSNGRRHIGYRRKALVIARTILTLYWGRNIGITEKERKCYPHRT